MNFLPTRLSLKRNAATLVMEWPIVANDLSLTALFAADRFSCIFPITVAVLEMTRNSLNSRNHIQPIPYGNPLLNEIKECMHRELQGPVVQGTQFDL